MIAKSPTFIKTVRLLPIRQISYEARTTSWKGQNLKPGKYEPTTQGLLVDNSNGTKVKDSTDATKADEGQQKHVLRQNLTTCLTSLLWRSCSQLDATKVDEGQLNK